MSLPILSVPKDDVLPSQTLPVAPPTAVTTFPLSLAEFKLILRLRELKKQVRAANRMRVELEVQADQISIIEARALRCEVFA